MRSPVACLVVLTAMLGGAASGGTGPTLAISATGALGDDDTIVISVGNPSSRVDIVIPDGYAFPRSAPSGGHAFIHFAGGTGERGVVSKLAAAAAAACAEGSHEQVWNAGFAAAQVFVFLSGQRMTICPLPAQTTEIVVASKYWSTPKSPGAYVWQATTADGAHASATIRLPVRLTLAQTKRGRNARVRARLTENGAPVARRFVQLVVAGRSTSTARTRADGSAQFAIRIRRATTVYAATFLGEDAGEPHTLQSNRLTLRPR